MSDLSASGIGQSLSQFLQQLATPTQTSTQATTPTATTDTTATAATNALTSATTTQTSGHHHHHHGGFKKIEDAVTNALQSADSGTASDGTPSDPNTIIQNVIKQLLGGTNGAAGTSATTTATTASAPNSLEKSDTSDFFDTLQSFGVSPEQFQSDFLAAAKDVQGGQINLGAAFQNLVTGTQMDTTG